MAVIKKGQLTQVTFIMVDKTDFATVETTITSGFTQKLWGVKHGVSAAATAKTPSKTISVIQSGVLRATLKASEVSDFDWIHYKITHASCAQQHFVFQVVDYDDSDIYSALSDHHSDFQSRVPKAVATNSQLSDLASDLKSYLAGLSATGSDIYSALSDFQSDFQSRVPKAVATNSGVSDALSKLQSDLRSYLAGVSDSISKFQSDFQSRVPKAVATNSQLSDLISDIRSQIQETFIVRRNTAQAGAASSITLDASASATNDLYKGQIIELVSGTGVGQTREIVAYNGTTKVATIFPNWTTNPDATTVFIIRTETSPRSHLSDAASDLRSYLVGISSVDSDIYSLLSDLQSDFQSRVPKRVATDSQLSNLISGVSALLSDIDSALTSQFNSISDLVSNAYSAAAQANSRALVLQSDLSDVKSRVTAMLPTRIVKNTALSSFIFTMVDSTDHITPKTGLTITSTRSLDGAAFGATTNSATEIGNGYYKINLAAGDLNGDVVALRFTATRSR